MAFISREPKEEEMSQGLRAIPLAEDPIVLIGNMDLPVENLRTKDIQAYLEGDKDDSFWVNMKFVHREASSGSRSAFLELLGVNNGEVFSPDLLAYSDKEVIQKVILNPGSMGYISYSFLKEALSLGVKPLSLDGLKPWQSKEDLILYPLARRLYLVMRDLDHQPTLTPMQNESMRQFIQLLTWDEIEAQWVNHGVLSTSLERLQDLLENWP
jgi:ABC-type phosphate transport system substrate-binding protein